MPILTAFVPDSVVNADPAGLELELLEKELNDKNSLCKSLFLKQLFQEEGAFSPDGIRRYFNEYSITLDPGMEYIAFLILIDQPQKRTAADIRKMYILPSLAMTAVKEAFDIFKMAVELERISDRHIAAISEAYEITGNIDKILDCINTAVIKSGFSVSIAYSSPRKDYTQLPTVIADLKKNLSHTLMFGIPYSASQGKASGDGGDFGIVNMQIKSICTSLKSNHIEKVYEQYSGLVSALKSTDAGFARDALMHLTFSIYETLAKSNDKDMKNLLVNMKDFHRKLADMETLSEINSLFRVLFSEITACIDNYLKTKNDKLVSLARDYIRQNFQDVNLSLSQVADRTHITASYLGKLFKQSTQMTFSDYLKDIRLQKSCELLNETTKTANAISELCGFTNSSYFYSVFKKRYRVTPSVYRNRKQAGTFSL